jgi:hypothetical protein
VRRDRTKRDEVLLSKGAGSYELAFTKPDFIEFRIAGSSRIAISTAKVSDTTTWHHIAVTTTGTSVAIYLDGQDVTGKVTARTLAASAAPLRVGSDGTSFFGGGVDELAVYGTALAPARVRAHFAAAG